MPSAAEAPSPTLMISLDGTLTPRLDWTGTYTADLTTCTAAKTANIPGLGAVDFFVTFADGFKDLRFIVTVLAFPHPSTNTVMAAKSPAPATVEIKSEHLTGTLPNGVTVEVRVTIATAQN